MGMFSWLAQDTNRSIVNRYYGNPKPVTMSDDKGNKWTEDNYEGYGVFGGKDYYELLAEMNGLTSRNEGIRLSHDDRDKLEKTPCLAEDPDFEWIPKEPKRCPNQGCGEGRW